MIPEMGTGTGPNTEFAHALQPASVMQGHTHCVWAYHICSDHRGPSGGMPYTHHLPTLTCPEASIWLWTDDRLWGVRTLPHTERRLLTMGMGIGKRVCGSYL